MRAFLIILGAVTLGSVALAETTASSSKPLTRVEVDSQEHVIRFIVNGMEVGRMTEQGLEVENSIAYGGTLTDRGPISLTPEDGEVPDAQ